MRVTTLTKQILTASFVALSLSACGGKGASYSLLPAEDAFRQTTQTIKGKLDILWVIDNSGSMQTSQDALAAAFPDWIDSFDSRGYDYRIAVTATDAFRTIFTGKSSYSHFRDGSSSTHSGIYIIDNTILDPRGTFVTNARLGTDGSGDERAFQSIKATFDNTTNPAFLRTTTEKSKLHVIILSDEDDVSHDTSNAVGYTDASLHPVSTYVSYLDGLTGSTAGNRNYYVHSLSVKTNACSSTLGGRPVGQRYMDLAAATGGKTFSICDDFAVSMSDLGSSIQVGIQDTFVLDRKPVVDTITVKLNGTVVPQGDPGWTYNSTENSVTLHAPYKPQPNDVVAIGYDPAGVK